jgi:hypothetical protein
VIPTITSESVLKHVLQILQRCHSDCMRTPASLADMGTGQDPADAGVEGNSRLTSATGLVLVIMLAVEGYTILNVNQLITLHIFLGIMLVGPALLKIASTMYRFVRYYSGQPAYVRNGPPHIVLRVLGPLVILSSLAVLGTGLSLLTVHGDGRGSLLLTAHRVSFIVWVAVMTIHVLGHIQEAVVSTWRELRQRSTRRASRFIALALALAIGVGGAAALMPSATHWTHRPAGFSRHFRR